MYNNKNYKFQLCPTKQLQQKSENVQIAQRKATPQNHKQFPGLNLDQIRNNANTIAGKQIISNVTEKLAGHHRLKRLLMFSKSIVASANGGPLTDVAENNKETKRKDVDTLLANELEKIIHSSKTAEELIKYATKYKVIGGLGLIQQATPLLNQKLLSTNISLKQTPLARKSQRRRCDV
ncbi:Hypothetical_protein [Hexamita inflata]|uniref:Hypothetical_protein n=1 Tax=Hexamita inflata TaxID=28002 RepID=A0AA86P420_9EUKA|nr:Hypothetical protein HINF_LOCUS18008 [Hexamita inflata]